MRRLVDDVDDHARIVCGNTERSGRLALERTDSDRFAGEIGGRPWPTLDRHRLALCRRDRDHSTEMSSARTSTRAPQAAKNSAFQPAAAIATDDHVSAAIEVEEDGSPRQPADGPAGGLRRLPREQEWNRHCAGSASDWRRVVFRHVSPDLVDAKSEVRARGSRGADRPDRRRAGGDRADGALDADGVAGADDGDVVRAPGALASASSRQRARPGGSAATGRRSSRAPGRPAPAQATGAPSTPGRPREREAVARGPDRDRREAGSDDAKEGAANASPPRQAAEPRELHRSLIACKRSPSNHSGSTRPAARLAKPRQAASAASTPPACA